MDHNCKSWLYTGKVVIGMDVAASKFYDNKDKTYDLNLKEDNNDESEKISRDSLKNVYKSFVTYYSIIVGDDLLVTNLKRVEKAIKEKSYNALLVEGEGSCHFTSPPSRVVATILDR
ncbi:hypothetical protein Lal_00015548, partial [Lupinus albus]